MEPGLIKVRVGQMSVDWTLKNSNHNEWRRSPDFAVGDTRCCLQVQYNSSLGNFIMQLCVGDPAPPPLHVTACLSVGANLLLPQTRMIKDTGNYGVWYKDASEVSKVAPFILCQPVWCFKIVIRGIGDSVAISEHKSVQTLADSGSTFGIQSLSNDLSKLLVEDSSTDVELKCGDATFKAHRTLLSVRSEVFRAMLSSEMAEGKTGRVQIVDLEADLFGHFLRYLYTGKLEELRVDTAERLFEIGDKYIVEALKMQCASFLADNLSRDNACRILSLADRHTVGDLKETVMAYILDQKIPLQDDIWPHFCNEHPLLANVVLNRFCKLQASCK